MRDGIASHPQLAQFLSMLGMARNTTITLVSGMDVAQLDHHHDPYSNSIGMLLGHVIAVELSFQQRVLELQLDAHLDEVMWASGLELWDRGRFEFKRRELHVYTEALRRVRMRTIETLRGASDEWLRSMPRSPTLARRGLTHALYVYHSIEDELRHQGQIVWLRDRVPGYPGAFANRRPSERPVRDWE